MDDSCAVCAETLEWVAYGACGHKDVCSTCVVRLRFICDDRRCCICKTVSDVIFVTKALGDYTQTINDFSALPSEPKEGRLGSYWYHEDTQAFFDDVDHYKMIKAMCRLSCSVCDKMEEHPVDGPRRRPRFRNIEQLKAHLFHQHRLVMCSLCLEGRKVFICEQKLYTRAQLNQHINSGDSEVDGSESERGGFTGHPICEFCRTPFYGDNELYSHMSTEHYTCHICQRQHPGQYEYYKNYDDLEIHFRRDHFLCEDEACLAKKFIVFQSEAELKRHNTLEHGGRMSRSKRSAALQLPTSFRYRRSNEQDNRRGRGRTFQRDTSENDLSMAIEASLEASNLVSRLPDPSSSFTRSASASGETSDAAPLISPFESLTTTDSEQQSARYREALGQNSRDAPLEESSFPPLPMAPGSSQSKSQRDASKKKAMASHRWGKNIKNPSLQSSSTGKPVTKHSHVPLTISPQRAWPASNTLSGLTSDSGLNKLAADDRRAFSSNSNPIPGRPASSHDSSSASYSSSHNQHIWPTLKNFSVSTSVSGSSKPAPENGPSLATYSSSVLARPAISNESPSGLNSSSKNRGGSDKINHSSSAPNLADSGSFDSSATDFPPVSAMQVRKLPTGSQVATNVEDIHIANKSLVERIRVALDFDQERFSAFKDISAEYRQGSMDAETYLVYVEQFGLSHLVFELARLCPDAHKQKELIETYNANRLVDSPRENGRDGAKTKEKLVDAGNSVLKDNLGGSIISTVRKLQSSYKPSEEVEVLSKDGYRAVRGKSKAAADECLAELSSTGESTNLNSQSGLSVSGDKDGRNKQRKKTSKFHRMRLGDGSVAAVLDTKNPNSDPDQDPDSNEETLGGQNNPTEGLPVRGVWRSGGGQRLFAMTSRGPKK